MIKKLDKSHGAVLGFKVSGDVTKDDYATLDPDVSKAIADHGTICILFDLTDFDREQIRAWGTDLKFGHDYHDQIAKMAFVCASHWDDIEAKLARPLYTQKLEFFTDIDDAWKWVDG